MSFRPSPFYLALILPTICFVGSAQAQELSMDGASSPTSLFSIFSGPARKATPESFPIDQALSVHELPIQPGVARAIDLTAAPDDLWIRIRNGFAMSNLNDDLVLHYQQWYQNRPDALRRMVERSRPYLHHIVEEIELRGMPTELALLPMVESSFNPMAYSRSHASGLWQFIPATGKRFNLEQNWWQDQRRDIVASTEAALDYLQTIYEMHGDWHLALASYNWGEGAVKRAVDKNQARGLPTDYVNLTMPNETRHYVPKLQALKNIFGDPALMAQLNIPAIRNRPYFATVAVSRPVDVKTAARLADMPVEEFIALNPSHNRPVIKPDTPVVIPAERLSIFQSNLQKHVAPLTSWQSYTLKPGERLDKVAPRFGITLSDLKRVNGLSGNIKLGSGVTLLVPSAQGEGGSLDELTMLPPAEVPEAPAKSAVVTDKSIKTPPVKQESVKKAATGKAAAKSSPTAGKAASAKATPAKASLPAARPAGKEKSASTGSTKAPAKPAEKAKAPAKKH